MASQNLNQSSMEFHCSRLGADGVAANFDGSWQSWGKIDPNSIHQANPESVYSLMERVGLTFTPLTTPAMGRNPVTGEFEEIPSLKNVWNGEGKYLATVGTGFNAESHWQTLESILPEILESSVPSRIIAFDDGGRMLAQFYVKQWEIGERKHNSFLTISNGIDGKTPLAAGWSLWTPVCSNTYASTLSDLSVTRRHSKGFSSSLWNIREKLNVILEGMSQVRYTLSKADSMPISDDVLKEFVSYMIPSKEGNKSTQNRQEELIESIRATSLEVGGKRLTAYDLFGGTTRYTTQRKQNRTDEQQLDYVNTGPGGVFNNKALSFVASIVG